MSVIDPSGASARAGETLFPDHEDIDPATVLLALSVAQTGVLYDTLAAQMTGADRQIRSAANVGAAIKRLSGLHDRVQDQELAKAESLLEDFRGLASRKLTGDEATPGVNKSEQEQLLLVEQWAQARGFPLGSLTRLEPIEPPPTEERAEGVAPTTGADGSPSEPPPVDMQLVLNVDELETAFDALSRYIDDLRGGAADNAALRSMIIADPDFAVLSRELRGLGVSESLDSLTGLADAVRSLKTMLESASNETREFTARLRLLTQDIQQSVGNLGALVQEQTQELNRTSDNQRSELDDLLRQAEFEEQQQAELQELAAAYAEAQLALETAGLVKDAQVQLSDAARLEAQSQLEIWRQDLAARLESVHETRPQESTARRRGQMYV